MMIKKIFEKKLAQKCVYLDPDIYMYIYIQYAGMIHLSEHVRCTTGHCHRKSTIRRV